MANQTFVPGGDITSDDKLWGLLSYLLTPIIPIIVLLMEDKKARPFIKYAAVQGLSIGVLIIVMAALGFLVIPACLAGLLGIYAIYLAIKTFQGEYVIIPVVTDFCKKQGWIS
ncbi:MAG: hypothetical protein GYA15_01780 [Leptolinea sp.]|jgi:uncharacterized membrane protein|nr:hypothetical protein [Leptolinea sp.]